MSLIAKSSGGGDMDYTPPPAGNHAAICVWLIDLGHQEWEYMGDPKDGLKVLLGFELDTEEKPGGDLEAFIQAKEYTLSLHENANLLKDLESWRGRSFTQEELDGFDLRNVLEKPCLVNVVHKTSQKGRTYAAIEGITPLPRGMPKPERKTPLMTFDMDDPDWDTFDELSEYRQEQIKKARNFPDRTQASVASPVAGQEAAEVDDDLPF